MDQTGCTVVVAVVRPNSIPLSRGASGRPRLVRDEVVLWVEEGSRKRMGRV
jgi:hypothetical protein